jgi:hypothetical protein
MDLSDENLEDIKQAAKRIGGYGSLTLHFSESAGYIDIEINDRVRLPKKVIPKAGEPVRVKRVVAIRQG